MWQHVQLPVWKLWRIALARMTLLLRWHTRAGRLHGRILEKILLLKMRTERRSEIPTFPKHFT